MTLQIGVGQTEPAVLVWGAVKLLHIYTSHISTLLGTTEPDYEATAAHVQLLALLASQRSVFHSGKTNPGETLRKAARYHHSRAHEWSPLTESTLTRLNPGMPSKTLVRLVHIASSLDLFSWRGILGMNSSVDGVSGACRLASC